MNIETTNKRKFAIFSVIMRYFTEPYKKYDGEWKGLCYYKKMADRRSEFKFTGFLLTAVIITLVILLNAL